MEQMRLYDRVLYFTSMFKELEYTSSRLKKQDIVNKLPAELSDDFRFCLEILDGRHKLGYTAYDPLECNMLNVDFGQTLREYLAPLWQPVKQEDFSNENIARCLSLCPMFVDFYIPLVNRLYRLGIGRSIIPARGMAPMLGKKFEPGITLPRKTGFVVTEKLDGNRCIAWFDGDHWRYQSRSGREMYVKFDMIDLPTDKVYDGEILSPAQVINSSRISNVIQGQVNVAIDPASLSFNKTSGLINQRSLDKDLVYNIFDIMDDDLTYFERRKFLQELHDNRLGFVSNVRILPTLFYFTNYTELLRDVDSLLDKVAELGGEGLMINAADAQYEHKRTTSLLKYKKVQTMDMRVIDVIPGTGVPGPGKNGSIDVAIRTADGKFINCSVGSGLSKEQCELWAAKPELIVGKVVEIAYHELSQNKSTYDTNDYSLRFPRLKRIRGDKNEPSEH